MIVGEEIGQADARKLKHQHGWRFRGEQSNSDKVAEIKTTPVLWMRVDVIIVTLTIGITLIEEPPLVKICDLRKWNFLFCMIF